jgi:MFS family permease
MATTTAQLGNGKITSGHARVIAASSLGTVFEWYDFYLYGSLTAIIGAKFFAGFNQTTGFIFALLAFAAGFAVRPFGALIFGRLGDLVGRKYTFLITIVIMGLSTFFVGLLPTYASIGIAAPIALITAVRRRTWPNTRRRASAVSTRAGSRRPRRSASFCR